MIKYAVLLIAFLNFGCAMMTGGRFPASEGGVKYVPDNSGYSGSLVLKQKSANSVEIVIGIMNPRTTNMCDASFDVNLDSNGQGTAMIENAPIKVTVSKDKVVVDGEPGPGYCGHNVFISGAYRVNKPIEFNFCSTVDGGEALMDCVDMEYSKVDIYLNDYYGLLRLKLSKANQEVLKKAQLSWVAMRDADCRYYTLTQAGAAAEYEKKACLVRATQVRYEELKQRYIQLELKK